MSPRLRIAREITGEEHELLRVMASDVAMDERTRKRARAILAFLESKKTSVAAERSDLSVSTVRKTIRRFNESGWPGLITVPSPRGGDFLSRYDQGYWAERLARAYLDSSREYRAIPYGTSRSEPFTDLQTFREYAINEFLLQAWSAGQRWKRPDLLLVPRRFLRQQAGNDMWTPDLKHWDNERCSSFVAQAAAAVEVETSLWQVARSTVSLSFTVKDEDLQALRAWVAANGVPLYILQVFYDEAHALAFSRMELLIGSNAPAGRKVLAKVDRFTHKATYMIPLTEGVRLGHVPEPDVQGRVWKAPNGRVTVYGRLEGSHIGVEDRDVLESLAAGRLGHEYND